jgi:hypothetical protein
MGTTLVVTLFFDNRICVVPQEEHPRCINVFESNLPNVIGLFEDLFHLGRQVTNLPEESLPVIDREVLHAPEKKT